MNKYSPIQSIHIKNFRNIGDVQIDFSKSPIVSLIGENDAGKTSVVKAFAVCGAHAYARDQKDYIRTGTQGFGIAIDFMDKSRIIRMKTATSNSYSVRDADGVEWSASKLDSGIPVNVQSIMGLVQEPETKEYLQIRTYEDLLLFVVTPASTNYKVMYDALKVDQLTRALKIGSSEANGLKSKLGNNEVSMDTLQQSMQSIKIYDLETLVKIKERIKGQYEGIIKFDEADRLANNISRIRATLGALDLLDSNNVKPIDVQLADRLDSASRLIKKICNLSNCCNAYSELDSVKTIDINNLINLKSGTDRASNIQSLKKDFDSCKGVLSLESIDYRSLSLFESALAMNKAASISRKKLEAINTSSVSEIYQDDINRIATMDSIIKLNAHINEIKAFKEKCDVYIEQVSAYLKQSGAAIGTCPKCGETVIIDTNN